MIKRYICGRCAPHPAKGTSPFVPRWQRSARQTTRKACPLFKEPVHRDKRILLDCPKRSRSALPATLHRNSCKSCCQISSSPQGMYHQHGKCHQRHMQVPRAPRLGRGCGGVGTPQGAAERWSNLSGRALASWSQRSGGLQPPCPVECKT